MKHCIVRGVCYSVEAGILDWFHSPPHDAVLATLDLSLGLVDVSHSLNRREIRR
jgi:hypothetical protein